MKRWILISLGGNALGTDFDELVESVGIVAKPIAELIQKGYEVVICHGNGPQVGMIKTCIDQGTTIQKKDLMPLSECVAMSQSYIGYHLQNAIQNQLMKKDIYKPVVTVITRVQVDKNDRRFQNPTKPIGAFFSKEEADELTKMGKTVIEDAGRGYREVVASPIPLEILEKESIKLLVENGNIVIAGGGGGIPTTNENHWYKKVDAVIDKDWVSVMLAKELEVDELVMLTGVEKVAINFNKQNQRWLDEMTVTEAKKYIDQGQFPEGSMLPKIKAAIQFTETAKDKKTLITSLDKLVEGLQGKTGTWIVN